LLVPGIEARSDARVPRSGGERREGRFGENFRQEIYRRRFPVGPQNNSGLITYNKHK